VPAAASLLGCTRARHRAPAATSKEHALGETRLTFSIADVSDPPWTWHARRVSSLQSCPEGAACIVVPCHGLSARGDLGPESRLPACNLEPPRRLRVKGSQTSTFAAITHPPLHRCTGRGWH
jgi:hypothetical protein